MVFLRALTEMVPSPLNKERRLTSTRHYWSVHLAIVVSPVREFPFLYQARVSAAMLQIVKGWLK